MFSLTEDGPPARESDSQALSSMYYLHSDIDIDTGVASSAHLHIAKRSAIDFARRAEK